MSLILSYSCSKDHDFTDPENLVDTSWKCTDGPSWWEGKTEYVVLKFRTTSMVEIWGKDIGLNEAKDYTAFYYIIDNNIDIDYGSLTGKIDGKTMNLIIDNQGPFPFIKQ